MCGKHRKVKIRNFEISYLFFFDYLLFYFLHIESPSLFSFSLQLPIYYLRIFTFSPFIISF